MRRFLRISTVAALAAGHACALPSSGEFSGGADAGAPPAEAGVPDAPGAAPDATAPDPYGDAVRADGPASWYRFEDAPGATTVKDETGAHPGAVEGTITLGVPGASGHAAHFAFKEGDVTLGDVYDFAGSNEYSIELWATPEPTGDDLILTEKRSGDTGMPGWILYEKGGTEKVLNFEFWETALFQHGDMALPDTMSHIVIAVRLSGGQELATMYIDGVAQADVVTANGGPDTTKALTIGNFFNGTLDEVAFYTKALTRDRVQAHFRAAQR